MEDDTMSKLATEKIKKGIEDENVMSLTEMTFNKTKDENELMVTLFYLPCEYIIIYYYYHNHMLLLFYIIL